MPARDSQPGRTASRPVVERLRSLCLTLPETSERSSWGHPNFRAGRKTFAAFEIVRGRPSIRRSCQTVARERMLAAIGGVPTVAPTS
jgi:hypothetical protein